MVINDKEVTRAYEPYRKEAIHIFASYVLLLFFLTIGYIIVYFLSDLGNPAFHIIWIGVVLFFFLVAVIINFRLALLSVFEEHRQLYIQKEVQIIRLDEDWDFYGKWNNILPKLYPPKTGVNRRKLRCVDSDGNKLILRSALGQKNAQLLLDEIYSKIGNKHTILYGKYTHIIVKFVGNDNTAFRLSRML